MKIAYAIVNKVVEEGKPAVDTAVKLDNPAFIAHVHTLTKGAEPAFEVPAYSDEFDADAVIKGFAEEGEPDWGQFEGLSDEKLGLFKRTCTIVLQVLADSDDAKKEFDSKAADRKMEKDEEKKAELAKKEERKGNFITAMKAGIDKADESFAKELEALQSDLPEGVTMVHNEQGGGQITLAEGADESVLASALGVLGRKADNSDYIKGQLQFATGDAVNLAVEAEIYPDKKAAAKQISAELEKLNIKFIPRSLETNARMAERTPLELRNPKVDPSAYLLVCQASGPKRKDFEKKEDHEAAVKEHSATRLELLGKLHAGQQVTPSEEEGGEDQIDPLTTRSEVKPLVDQMQIQHGLQEEKDPSVKTSAELLRQLFFARYALANLLGTEGDLKDVAVFQLPIKAVVDPNLPEGTKIELENDKEIKICKVTKAELEAFVTEAEAGLEEMLVKGSGLTAADFKKGEVEVEVQVKVEVEGEMKVQKDPLTKKPKVKKVDIPCYFGYPFKG